MTTRNESMTWHAIHEHRGLRRAALLCGVCVLVMLEGPAAADTPLGVPPDALGRWFVSRPELRTTKSSGWKPYQRRCWFLETRRSDGPTHPGRLRARALARARAVRAAGARVGGGWFNIGPTNLSGRATAIDVDPTDSDRVYVGTPNGGVWRTEDGGATWSTTTDDLPSLAVGALLVLPWSPNVVLVGTGDGTGSAYGLLRTPLGIGILRSADGGDSWQTTSLSYPVSGTHGFNEIACNPITRTILAGANDGLWRSTDDGESWTLVLGGGNFFDVTWRPGDPSHVYVAKGRDPFLNMQTDNGVLASDDDGLTFALAGTGQPQGSSIGKTKLAVSASDPDVVYAHYSDAGDFGSIGIYRSVDAGATWFIRNVVTDFAGGQGWYNLVLAADPDDADRLIAGGVHLYTSDDAGITFLIRTSPTEQGGNATTPHVDQHVLTYEPSDSDAVWVGCDGGVWRSTDDGDSWASRREGIISFQYYDICTSQTDPLFVVGGTQDNGVPSRDAETAWSQTTLGGDGAVCNIGSTSTDEVYGELQLGNHFFSTDRGQSWVPRNNGLVGTGIFITPVAQDPNDDGHIYTMSASTGIYRSTDGMISWQNVAPHFARWISVSRADGDVVWTVSNFSGVWHTATDGESWTQSVTFPATGQETKIDAHPTDASSAFVTFGGYSTGTHVVRTIDSGATWQDVTGDFPDLPANTLLVDPQDPERWIVGSDAGVWTSTDGGITWLPLGTGLANVVVTDLEMNLGSRKLVAGTFGRGAWEIDLPLNPVSTPPRGPSSEHLMLDAPRPNPASGEALFRFAARGVGGASLQVFDSRGRLVSRVVSRAATDGVVRVARWDTRSVPPGTYFAVLSTAEERSTRRVTVVR